MATDYKSCATCAKEMNILDDHEECYRHRVCNAAFPCDTCKHWPLEKRQQVSRMVEKAMSAANKKRSTATSSVTPVTSNQPSASEISSPLVGTDIATMSSPLVGVPAATESIPSMGISDTNSASNPHTGVSQCNTMPMAMNSLMNNGPDMNMFNPFMWMMNPDTFQNLIDSRVRQMLNSGPTTSTCTSTIVTSSISGATVMTSARNSVGKSKAAPQAATSRHRYDKFASADTNDMYEDISEVNPAGPQHW